MGWLSSLFERWFGPKSVLAEPGFDPTVDPLPSQWFGNRAGGGPGIGLWVKLVIGLILAGVFIASLPHIFTKPADAQAGGPTQTVTPLPTWTATPSQTASPLWTAIPSVTPYGTPFAGFDHTAVPVTRVVMVTSVVFTPSLTENVQPTQTPWIIYRSSGGGSTTVIQTVVVVQTQAPLPTYTPYGPPAALPTYTPYPTYTPPPTQRTATPWPTFPPFATYTPWPTYTPYPTPHLCATGTFDANCIVIPTSTPYPTYTPLATLTALPSQTPLATYTPLASQTPYPTYTAVPSDTPSQTPTSSPTATETETPTETATP